MFEAVNIDKKIFFLEIKWSALSGTVSKHSESTWIYILAYVHQLQIGRYRIKLSIYALANDRL